MFVFGLVFICFFVGGFGSFRVFWGRHGVALALGIPLGLYDVHD